MDLTDPGLFSANAFWSVLAELRADAPVYRHPEPHGPGFWVLTRHRDIVRVYADHERFSSRYGMRLDTNPDAVSSVAQRMLIVSDPPDHTRLKRILGKPFGPGELPRIEQLVRSTVTEILDKAVHGEPVDFAEMAKQIPNHVICALMGIPRQDWAWLGSTTTEAFDSDNPEKRSAAHSEVFLYFTELLEERRSHPNDDYISRIAHRDVAAEPRSPYRPLSDEEIVFNCNGVLSGANETTKYSALGSLLAFSERPNQWTLLRNRGKDAVSGAVEEILRWTTPGIHAMRTALRPTVIHGVPIAAGDKVTLWNVSANRDEEVFDQPHDFDIARSPNHHVAFGHGRHVCIGSRLARLELAVFVEELMARVSRIELAGTPGYNSSNFTWGLSSLPIRLVPATSSDSWFA